MNSMTGYGRAQDIFNHLNIVVELTSVNRKTLETTFSIPKEFQMFERILQELIQKSFLRGKFHLSIKIQFSQKNNFSLFDTPTVQAYLNEFENMCKNLNIPVNKDADFLLKFCLAINKESLISSDDSIQELLVVLTQKAIQELKIMRQIEGDTLAKDILRRINIIQSLTNECINLSANMVESYRDQLLKRLRSSGIELDFNDDRLLKELALYADKIDVSEEFTRLNSHLKQFETFINKPIENESIGRKFDFLCQEIFREFNTLCNKSTRVDIIQKTLDCKNEIERIREQCQNIE